MSKYEGTKTEKNLMEAFAGESMARNKYTYFASVAKKAGFEQIAALFLETADQEKEHAKMWFKEFHGLGDTAQNLIWAAEGENDEWTNMYARMADEAVLVAYSQVDFASMTDGEIALWYNDNVIYPDKVLLNCYYYRNYSFVKDIQMIFATVLGKRIFYAGEEIQEVIYEKTFL